MLPFPNMISGRKCYMNPVYVVFKGANYPSSKCHLKDHCHTCETDFSKINTLIVTSQWYFQLGKLGPPMINTTRVKHICLKKKFKKIQWSFHFGKLGPPMISITRVKQVLFKMINT